MDVPVRALLGFGGPIVLGVAVAVAEAREYGRVRRLRAAIERDRSPERFAAPSEGGEAQLLLRIPAGGPRTSLGTSAESPDSLSGAPELETADVVLEDQAGTRYRIPAGAKLKVHSLGGAHRNLAQSITRDDGGITQRFSFEVEPGKDFVLACQVPVASRADDAGPFRSVDEPIVLSPRGERFELNPPREPPTASQVGCAAYPLLAVGAFAATSPERTVWIVVGWLVWTIAMLFGLAARFTANEGGRALPSRQPRSLRRADDTPRLEPPS